MSARPAALMIAPTMPARSGNGLAMRLGIFLEALCRVLSVDLLVVPASGVREQPDDLPRELGAQLLTLGAAGDVDTEFKLLSRLRDDAARLAAFRAYGRPSFAARVTMPVKSALASLARERGYALIHVGRSYMVEAGIAARHAGAKLTLDLDEDDRVSLESQAARLDAEGSAAEAAWLRAEGEACDGLIARFGADFDATFAASPEDAATLASRHPGLGPVVVPNAVAIPASPGRRPDPGSLLFVGTMSYLPNREGLRWLADEVWPRLVRLAPRPPSIRIAGAGPLLLPEGHPQRHVFETLGFVPDLTPLYARASLVVAPLLSGGGTRIKLLEAAAHGVPIVATSLAVRGLPLTDPESVWIADGPEAFAQACAAALAHPAEAARRAAAARKRVAESHDRGDLVGRLTAEFERTLAERRIRGDVNQP